MGCRRQKIMVVLGALFMVWTQAKADGLDEARDFWQQGNREKALEAYRDISFQSPAWREKLHDAFAINIFEKNYQEAWRVSAIAHRLEVSWDGWDYDEALAATLGGACTLNRTISNRAFENLLHAYIYRFAQKFSNPAETQSQEMLEQGRVTSSIAIQQAPYLKDIPRTTLLSGRGCRYWPYSLQANDQAETGEYEELLRWYKDWKDKLPATQIVGSRNVLIRLLILADKRKDKTTFDELIQRFKKFEANDWIALDDKEKRYLWQLMIKSGQLPSPPLAIDSPYTQIIQAIVLHDKSRNAGDWLGLIDYRSLAVTTQTQLLEHLGSLPENTYNDEVNLEKARLAYLRGAFPESLQSIRKILILGEANQLDQVEKALFLASQIMAEYGYDERLQGAMQSSIPTSYWRSIYQDLMIDAALKGDRHGMEFILKHASASSSHQRLFGQGQEQLIRAIGQRNLSQFERELNEWKKMRRLGSQELQLTERIVSRTMGYDQSQYEIVKPFLKRIADLLEGFLRKGGDQQSRMEDMYHALRRDQLSHWGEGSSVARTGTVQAGAVNISVTLSWPNPFRWSTAVQPPRRELLAIPTGRDWREWMIR